MRMKKIMLGAATCALLLSGCSTNEVIDSPAVMRQGDGSIRFGVNTPVTRAANLWENDNFTETGRTFNVVGRTADGKDYLGSFTTPKDVKFDGTEWTYDNKLYWPTSSLNFFSWYENDDATVAGGTGVDANAMTFTSFKVKSTISDQKDFLIGAGTYNKEEISTIYLKHALTKVLFKAEVLPGSQLKVSIDNVGVYNLMDQGDLKATVASDAGKPKMDWTNQAVQGDAPTSNAKYEMGQFTAAQTITAPIAGAAAPAAASLVANTAEADKSAMLLMPQVFDAWEPLTLKIADNAGNLLTGDSNPLKTGNTTGAFIGVKCTIEALNTDGAPLEYLHGALNTTKWLYIPISSIQGMYGEWTANRAITYVITFGDTGSGSGGGGWTGDDGDGDGKIDPVLVPINFRVDVSDWENCDVILQSVNFNRSNLDDSNLNTEIKKLADMLVTEANNNPQKKYAAKFDLTYGTGKTAGVGDQGQGVVIDLNTFKDNSKFLPGSTIAIKISAGAWATSTGISFRNIDGWDRPIGYLSADGTITYTKTAMSEVETYRLNAMKPTTVMTINGTPTTNTEWNYSSVAFTKLTTSGNYIALNFADLKESEKVKITIGSGFKIVAVATPDAIDTADFTAAGTEASANVTNKILVIKRN